VNGTRLHYVSGGEGEPLVLLPGWPRTWWQYHKVMPEPARHYRVIAVDLRGMGDSDKPDSGYDKKAMALCALGRVLRHGRPGPDRLVVGVGVHEENAMVRRHGGSSFPFVYYRDAHFSADDFCHLSADVFFPTVISDEHILGAATAG
jgi:pimeloyl-ACP methyl ester carboxylesterase